MTVKLTSEELNYIALFEGTTGARVKDCVIEEDRSLVTFVVNEGDIGLAIGKSGSSVKRVRNMIGRSVGVVEYSEDPLKFLKNAFLPAKVKSVKISEQEGKRVATVVVDVMDKRLVLGRRRRKLLNAKKLAQRHHQVNDIVVK
jgi:N utilization substance protein A